ncbi:hypothetical protein FQN54_008491 [Arachnomyces sp. PD_36]|nr:hypothetical protein FQN54_008491 [Arachnomyces sp. PD_36]
MPGTVAEPPSVALSFANNFWGKDDGGVGPMFERMHNAKVTCDEMKTFYGTRAAIEDEYARKLLSLSRKSLGSGETGTIRASLDVVRAETEAIGKSHSAIAAQMKSELEEPLAAFSGGMKERRKIVQNGIERLLKSKIQQTQSVNKTRDRYEQDCLRIKGYLAQGHMVMGQEERKNKAKLEKTQVQLASSSSEYEAAIKILEETTGRWNKEWKAACDKFQDLEEERLDFSKSSLWNYANIASTVCVSDDASCEKIRLALEGCEVEKDITHFIKERGTGQEIPDAPKYINFCRGDINDSSSEASEEESYSVAQFQRAINPAFRSSSPQPSTYESHHDPRSELAERMGHADHSTPSSREATVTPQKPAPQQFQPDPRREPVQPDPRQEQFQPDPRREQMQPDQRREFVHPDARRDPYQQDTRREPPMQPEPLRGGPQSNGHREPVQQDMRREQPEPRREPMQQNPPNPPRELVQANARRQQMQPDESRELVQAGARRGGQPPAGYQASQHGDIPAVPHNEYPTDGMTMFCRTGPPSERSSATSANRPSSRGSQSEVSNPTSFSSQEPPSGKQSPTKPTNGVAMPGMESKDNKQVQKKRSAFFSNSPFRRKSKHEKDRQTAPVLSPASRNTWGSGNSSRQTSPTKSTYDKQTRFGNNRPSASPEPEPVDPRANFQLNVGNNVFDVASPDKNARAAPQPSQNDQDLDPIARALADLKGVGKQSSVRVSADRYHGISTPAPSAPPSNQGTATNGAVAAAQRGTPPPAYNDAPVKRLDAPQPAFTSAQMQKTTQKYVGQKQEMFNNRNTPSRPTTRAGTSNGDVPRAVSPAARRSASPQPAPRADTRASQYGRGNPSPSSYHSSSMNSRHRQSPSAAPSVRGNDQGYQQPQQQYSRHASPNDLRRSASPQPQFARQDRPSSSAGGMELQLSNSPGDNYGGGYADSIYEGSQRGRDGQRGGGRPMSMYYGGSNDGGSQSSRVRSKSVVIADTPRQFSRDGRPILHYARAVYNYTAAIPEELGFMKGDVLAVLRMQDDGWWEAEVTHHNSLPGLVPSNYLQAC